MIGYATEIRRRAERRAGELLIDMEKNKGVRGQLRGDIPAGGRAPTPPTDPAPKLASLGITKTQSARWQKVAALPAEQFEEQLQAAKRKAVASIDSTQNQGLKRQLRADREAALGASTAAAAKALGSQLYGVVYADPPWSFMPYSTETGMDRAAEDVLNGDA